MPIELINVGKRFADRQVLQGISCVFQDSRVNMIIGASGSGKTVTMKIMVGLLPPDEGQVLYDGVDLHRSSGRQQRRLRQQIGMLFQSSALFDSINVGENVRFPLRMFSSLPLKQQWERVAFCLEQVGLAGTERKRTSELSGGMKKRAGLARAIVLNPKYLLCDEPNSGLDPITAEKIDELIRHLTLSFGTTTVVITHDIKSVLNIGDHVMFIDRGQKAWEGTREELLNAANPAVQDFVRTSGLLGGKVPNGSPIHP